MQFVQSAGRYFPSKALAIFTPQNSSYIIRFRVAKGTSIYITCTVNVNAAAAGIATHPALVISVMHYKRKTFIFFIFIDALKKLF